MDISAIKSSIAEACRQESRSHSLRRFFQSHLPDLQARLCLPGDNPVDALVDFARRYIDAVPEFLSDIAARCTGPDTSRFLNIAEDFFLAPPEMIEEEEGLKALLDEAFLVQRLVEELNDRQRVRGEPPLLRLDVTRANIIVHHLLGDPLAAQLEALVGQCLEWMNDHSGRFVEFAPGTPPPDYRWPEVPCMSLGSRIDLRLTGAG